MQQPICSCCRSRERCCWFLKSPVECSFPCYWSYRADCPTKETDRWIDRTGCSIKTLMMKLWRRRPSSENCIFTQILEVKFLFIIYRSRASISRFIPLMNLLKHSAFVLLSNASGAIARLTHLAKFCSQLTWCRSICIIVHYFIVLLHKLTKDLPNTKSSSHAVSQNPWKYGS